MNSFFKHIFVPQEENAPAQRRGSLMDANGAAGQLLNAAKARKEDSDSDGGDDWD